MNKLTHLIRPDLLKFNPYSSARDEAHKGTVWLNANESPYPHSLNRYPQKQPAELQKILASLYGVDNNQMVISRGSDEVIDLLPRLFCRAENDAIMICTPTYGMYSVSAQLQGAKVITIPLKKEAGFQLDSDAILARWTPAVKIIFLCSPNNPTGNILNKDDIIYLCKQLRGKSIIVIDEAYIEFADKPSLAGCINQYDNLVVLRTLSKAYGLAAARCGVLLAQEELVQWMLNILPPYPVPAPVTLAVMQVLTTNKEQIKRQVTDIKSERSRLFDVLKSMPFVIHVWPSEANYLLMETTNAQKIMDHCAEQGIIIRNMNDKPNLKNCVRITIGLMAENDQLINALNKYL